MCFAPELRNGADLRRMEQPLCPISGQRQRGNWRESDCARFASARGQRTWILQCNLSSPEGGKKGKKYPDSGCHHPDRFPSGRDREEGDTGRAYRKEVGEAASEPETSSNSSSNEWQEAFLF